MEEKLENLSDLKSFLENELKGEIQFDNQKAFQPLTTGLGLESPKRQTFKQSLLESKEIKKTESKPETKPESKLDALFQEEPSSEEKVLPKLEVEVSTKKAPPPLPQLETPSAIRRFFALLIDEIFVLTFWLMAIVVTANVFSDFTAGLSTKIFQSFSDPLFLRAAALEFAALWLGYLSIGIGLMNMTFGMWVWNIRVSFGDSNSENYMMRKIMRVFWSFVFYGFVIPSFLLVITKKGKNLLDVLTGSQLHAQP